MDSGRLPIPNELAFAQLAVTPTTLHQLIVGSAINNSTFLKNHNSIRLLHRCQTMGDDQHRSSFHRLLKTELNCSFRLSIESTGGLIKEQQRWIS